jgi:hypothetical protein
MSIKRAPRPDSNFYLLNKSISEDPRLSWGARGLLVFLLGKPDNWEVSTAHLVKQTAEASKKSGRDAVLSLLKELITTGYVTRTTHRKDGGEFGGYDYLVSETPKPENPAPAAPDTDSPYTDKPDPVNPTQVSTEVKTNTETNNNTRSIAKKTATDPAPGKLDQLFDQLWQHYPKREGSNPRKRASQNFNARLREGHTIQVMAEGLARYIEFCKAKGQVGTGFVMQAQRFFGTSLEFLNEWAVSVEQRSKASNGMIDPSDTSWIHEDWGY